MCHRFCFIESSPWYGRWPTQRPIEDRCRERHQWQDISLFEAAVHAWIRRPLVLFQVGSLVQSLPWWQVSPRNRLGFSRVRRWPRDTCAAVLYLSFRSRCDWYQAAAKPYRYKECQVRYQTLLVCEPSSLLRPMPFGMSSMINMTLCLSQISRMRFRQPYLALERLCYELLSQWRGANTAFFFNHVL